MIEEIPVQPLESLALEVSFGRGNPHPVAVKPLANQRVSASATPPWNGAQVCYDYPFINNDLRVKESEFMHP